MRPPDPSPGPIPDPGSDAPPFAEPWQAQVFALTVALHDRGLVSWSDWATALGAELEGAAPDGSDYYARWLAALERLLAAHDIAASPEVAALAESWRRAARATPHGQPVTLDNDPEGPVRRESRR